MKKLQKNNSEFWESSEFSENSAPGPIRILGKREADLFFKKIFDNFGIIYGKIIARAHSKSEYSENILKNQETLSENKKYPKNFGIFYKNFIELHENGKETPTC